MCERCSAWEDVLKNWFGDPLYLHLERFVELRVGRSKLWKELGLSNSQLAQQTNEFQNDHEAREGISVRPMVIDRG